MAAYALLVPSCYRIDFTTTTCVLCRRSPLFGAQCRMEMPAYTAEDLRFTHLPDYRPENSTRMAAAVSPSWYTLAGPSGHQPPCPCFTTPSPPSPLLLETPWPGTGHTPVPLRASGGGVAAKLPLLQRGWASGFLLCLGPDGGPTKWLHGRPEDQLNCTSIVAALK